VRVQRFGVDVPTAHLTLTHAAGPGCTAGQTLTYDTAAVTDSNGRLTLAVPYGTWTVTVDGSSPNTAWPVITVSPLDSQPRSELNVSIL